MKAKDVPCRKCGCKGKLYGSDSLDEEGPWFVACSFCGEDSAMWAYPREAWKQWKIDNLREEA